MKKMLLAFAAAATLGLATLAPGTASAAPAALSIQVGSGGIDLVRNDRRDHRDHRRYDRRHGWHGNRHPTRQVCEVKRVRQWTHGGWRIKKVRECYQVRRR